MQTGAALCTALVVTSVSFAMSDLPSQLSSRFWIAAEQTDGDCEGELDCEKTGEPIILCGNGILDRGEQCDDGNLVDADGCDAQCTTGFNSYPINLRLMGPQTPPVMQYELTVGESILLKAGKQTPVAWPSLNGYIYSQLGCQKVSSSYINYKEFRWNCVAKKPSVHNVYFTVGTQQSNLIKIIVKPKPASSSAASSSVSSVASSSSSSRGPATLNVAVKALNQSGTTVVGAQDIRLFRFEARSGSTANVLLNSLILRPNVGDGEDMSRYALWVDSNGDSVVDTVIQNNVVSQGMNDDIIFNNLTSSGFLILANQTVVFEIRGDVAPSASGVFRLAFATTSTSTPYVEAEDAANGADLTGIQTDGVCLVVHCRIKVTTSENGYAGTLWAIVEQGNLYMKRNQVLPSHQLLGGTVAEYVLELSFTAENEDIRIEDLIITGSGRNATSVQSVQLFLGNASTPFATASFPCQGSILAPTDTESTLVNFCAHLAADQLIIPADAGDVLVRIRPVIKSNFAGGSGSDVLVQFLLASNETATNDIRQTGSVIVARGLESNGTLDMNDGDSVAEGEIFIHPTMPAVNTQNAIIKGVSNHIVMTKLASITNDGPATGQLAAGLREIARIRFQSAPHNNDGNDFTLSGIVLNVNVTNASLFRTGITLANANNPENTVNCKAYAHTGVAITTATTSGSFLAACESISRVIDAELSSGEANSFILKADISNPQIVVSTTSSLQVSLQSFNNIFGFYGRNNFSAYSHILWVDTGGPETRDVKYRWIDSPETQVFSTLFRS